MPDKIKVWLAAAAALIILLCLFVIVFQVVNNSRPENNGIVVYKKGNESIIRIGDLEAVVDDLSAANFKCDEENGRVFYTVDSSYKDGLYDLYFVRKHRSELVEPKIIDVGIQGTYDVVSGNVYYLKRNSDAGANDGCICDVDNGKIETFSTNVENIFPLKNSNQLYFTKMHGENTRVLYKYEDGGFSEICRDLTNIFLYNKTENPHIIYEKKSLLGSGISELYIAYSDSEPEMICDSSYLVLYDDYSPSGNLYYFTTAEETVSWSYVIADQYSETDKLITKPKRDDFFSIFGISAEYNAAFDEYTDKLIRDEIRAALNEAMINGDFSVPVYNLFAYNQKQTLKIAENIDPTKVYSVSAFGEPKVIFESAEVLPSNTDMNTLVEIAQRSKMSEVIDYACAVVDDSIKSEGMAFAAYGSEGAVKYALEGYDKTKTLFSFASDGSRIFAFVRDSQGERLNLYTNSIDSKMMPSAETVVDTGVSSYRFVDDSVLYLKSDINTISGDVYVFDGLKAEKLSNAASAFTVENGNIILLKDCEFVNSQQFADYYIYSESAEKLIDRNIVVESFKYGNYGKAAYISQDGSGNRLCIYNGGKSVTVANGATEILLFI